MNIIHETNDQSGSFYILLENKKVAEMTYRMKPDHQMVIEHTEVGQELAGQGAGKKMLLQAVEFARKNHLKVIPVCPFAKSVFDKMEDIRDVL